MGLCTWFQHKFTDPVLLVLRGYYTYELNYVLVLSILMFWFSSIVKPFSKVVQLIVFYGRFGLLIFVFFLFSGAEPKQLSFSAALGITLGVFPICGKLLN